jgi:ribonuclease D
VQIIVGGEIVVLDPLAGFDPAPLAEVLADEGVQIVLHAGRQDVAILRREWKTDVTNVFDTQVAAGFAGFAARPATPGCCTTCSRSASPRPRASRAGTSGR